MGRTFSKLNKERRRDLPENDQEKINNLVQIMDENSREGDQFSVRGTTYTRTHKETREGVIEFESNFFNPWNRARIIVERKSNDGAAYAHLECNEEYYDNLGNSKEVDSPDSRIETARLLLKAERIAREQCKYDTNPDPELVDNYNEMLSLSTNEGHSYYESGDMPIPGYVERFEQASYVSPNEYEYKGVLPSEKNLEIKYKDNYVQAFIGQEQIASATSKFQSKHERIAFLAKAMKALNDHPELSLEVEEDY